MDHPSVELQIRFDGDTYDLVVPRNTTQFYWGVVRVGTVDSPPASLQPRTGVSQTKILEATRDRIVCSLIVDGESVPLLQELRRSDGRCEHALWTAINPQELPTTATVILRTENPVPTVAEEPLALWTTADERIPWGETVETELQLGPDANSSPMRTDGLWGRHEAYIPQPVNFED
jgi:hypothetical protein